MITDNESLRRQIRKTLAGLLNEIKIEESDDLIEPETESADEEIEEAMIRSHAHGKGQSSKPCTYPEEFKREALRESIQLAIESISNFIKPQPETATKQLADESKPQELGDPLFDVEMNQMADDLGSDEANAPTVAVTAGGTKGGNGPEAGQHQANFKDKTKLA
jgi:hypothetical protein